MAGFFQSNWDEVTDNFDDMQLKEELLRGIYAYGFEKPSAIQQRAIMPCIKGQYTSEWPFLYKPYIVQCRKKTQFQNLIPSLKAPH